MNIEFDVRVEATIFREQPARPIHRRHSTQIHNNQEPVARTIIQRRSSNVHHRHYVVPDDLRDAIGTIRQQISKLQIRIQMLDRELN